MEEGRTGSYELSVEPAPSCGPGTALTIPTSLDETLSIGDCLRAGSTPTDSFAISLVGETPLSLRMTSSVLSPLLVLVNASGIPTAWIDASENGSTLPDTADLRVILTAGEWSVLATSTTFPAIGDYRLEVGEALCPAPDTIAIGEQRMGGLSSADCRDSRGSHVDRWILDVPSETSVRIDLTSSQFDAFLAIYDGTGQEVAVDDDGAGGFDSRIQIRLVAGEYRITAGSFFPGETGSYALSVTQMASTASAAPRVQASSKHRATSPFTGRLPVPEPKRQSGS